MKIEKEEISSSALFLLFVTLGITTDHLVLWLCLAAVAIAGRAEVERRKRKREE